MMVCMLLKNNFVNDARVYNEAMTLLNAGYTVTIIAIKDEKTKVNEVVNGIRIKRVTIKESNLKRFVVDMSGIVNKSQKSVLTDKISTNCIYRNIRKVIKVLLNFRWSFMFEIAFLKAATREKADIYHAHDLNTLFHAWVATIINKSVLVYDAHELESELVTAYSKSPMIVRLKCEIIEGIFIKKARDVITVSESIAKVLTDRYHIKPPHVIKNCPRISKAEPHDRIRQIFGIDKSKKIIVYQGNFTPDKEIEKLVEIACCIDSAVLVLIGDGVTKARVEAKVIDTNMAKRVFFLGRIPNNELLSYTAGGDIGLCIFPNSCLNIYYSLPNKIFEYLMAGLPVVASDFPEIKKIVEEHNVGRTVVSTNPIEIANIINKIFDDDRLYRQMRENARRIAVSIYNWENESKKLLKLYEEL